MTKQTYAKLQEKAERVEGDSEPFIETATGKRFHFLDPKEDEIDILDIAHALSNQCRFTGHTRDYYSIAEHSMLVANLVADPALKLCALLHDATEAYLTDVATPVKDFITNYRTLEKILWIHIARKFGLPVVIPEEIHKADKHALYIEAQHLLPSEGRDWAGYEKHRALVGMPISCHVPKDARFLFLVAFEKYSGIDLFGDFRGEEKFETWKDNVQVGARTKDRCPSHEQEGEIHIREAEDKVSETRGILQTGLPTSERDYCRGKGQVRCFRSSEAYSSKGTTS